MGLAQYRAERVGLEAAARWGHISGTMKEQHPIIEMTLEGEFVAPPGPPRPPVGTKIMLWAIVATVLSMALLMVVLTFWLIVAILPFVLIAGAIAYTAYRYRMWRSGRSFVRWRGPLP